MPLKCVWVCASSFSAIFKLWCWLNIGLSWTFSADIHALGTIFSDLRNGLGILTSDDDFQRVCALQAFIGPLPQRIAVEGSKTRPGYFESRDNNISLAWRKRMNEREYELLLKRREIFDVRLVALSVHIYDYWLFIPRKALAITRGIDHSNYCFCRCWRLIRWKEFQLDMHWIMDTLHVVLVILWRGLPYNTTGPDHHPKQCILPGNSIQTQIICYYM